MRNHKLISLIAALALAGCGNFGQVNQGQVVHFDKAAGIVTLISDSNYKNPSNPVFDVLPAAQVRVPVNPDEMGPAPHPGRLVDIDTAARQAVVYDPASGAFERIPYTPVEQRDGVAPNDAVVAGREFPVIDRQAKSITIYSRSRRTLVKFTLEERYLHMPDDAWRFGDLIRYYYKDPGQALRMMNVTRTDVLAGK